MKKIDRFRLQSLSNVKMRHVFAFLIVFILYGCHSGEKKHAGKTGDISIVRLEDIDTDP
jgi:hypothetical protein